jgi:hypothetical protein
MMMMQAAPSRSRRNGNGESSFMRAMKPAFARN